jgi:LmbE family N-acetylglucosaminyl deacetylase
MKILAVGAHSDDLEILCAGTLARYSHEGHKVIMAHLCKGDKGHHHIPPDELAKIRDEEAVSSASIIGAEHINLGIEDLDVYLEREQVSACVELIRQTRPDIIITHSPDDYMPDHTVTSELIFNSSFIATLPHTKTKHKYFEKMTPIYYMDTLAGVKFHPTEYVDISDTFSTKKEMLSCHQSQLKWLKEHDKIDILEFIEIAAKSRGLQCGVLYAEGFRKAEVWGRNTTKRLLP